MKVKFLTLGCKVNQYETQGLKEKFLSLGCETTQDKADFYVINTCSVTQKADHKSKQAILKAKKENSKAKIVVSGCLAQLDKEFIEELGVDYVIPQDQKHLLPEIVLNLPQLKNNISRPLRITHFSNHRAFIKVQDGCDHFCSFCKIPYLRGKPKSQPKVQVLEEVKAVSQNHKEIVLCGINLGLYGKDLKSSYALEDLVEDILKIPDLGRLRLSSLEPILVSKKLLSFLSHKKLCPHLHLPFQYGDDYILNKMNKKETVALYEDLVKASRKINPSIALSCDIMVGFPEETEKSFQNTVDFLNRIKPMRMHIFTFSPRQKTKVYSAKVNNRQLVRARYDVLKELAARFSLNYQKKFIGKTLDLVAEERSNGSISGYTENYLKVQIKEKALLGEIIPVRINKVEGSRLFGQLD
jgi:threonylcarbamoyladenosine tRNA methylthiotransferase MtaB